MQIVSSIASVVLGVVFVAAGASKLAGRETWRATGRAFGVPRGLVASVPLAEIVIGALLVAQVAEPWPAVAAIGLLLGFSAAIARLLARGEHPACACFGAWSASPIGPRQLARNAVLLAVAMLALYG